MKLSDSTKRSLRTAYKAIVAILTVVPIAIAALPVDLSTTQLVVLVAASIAAVDRAINALEDAGLVPAWLRS